MNDKGQINVREPATWYRGITRFGSLDRHLEGFAFCFDGLQKMGVSQVVTVDDALRCEEYLKKIEFLPKDATLDCFCTMVTQDLVVFRFSHWSFPKVNRADVISCIYYGPEEIKKRG